MHEFGWKIQRNMWLLLIVAAAAFSVSASETSNLVVKLENLAGTSGRNRTFMCDIERNTSTGLQPFNGPVDIIWLFTPVGSNTSIVVLNSNETQAPPVGLSNDDGSEDKADRTRNVKYYRQVWPHMTIIAVNLQDAGQYTCKLKDLNISASAQLFVVEKQPACTKNATGPQYFANDTVRFTCTLHFHGNQSPLMNWHEPSLGVDMQHITVTHDNTRTQVSTSINVRVLPMVDGKQFDCSAIFPMANASVFKCDITLPPSSVHYATYITTMQTQPHTRKYNHEAEEGATQVLYCTARGNPPPHWRWTFTPDAPGGLTKTLLPLTNNRVLSIHNLTVADTGTYTCTVSNRVRNVDYSDTKSLHLRVITKHSGSYIPHNSTTSLPEAVEYKGKGISPFAVGAIVCASLAVILIIVFIILAMKMRSREQSMHDRLTWMHDENLDDQEVELLDENIQPDSTELPAEYGRLKQQWEIARKDIRLVDLIAKGSFVEVWRGRMRKYPRRNEIMKVAIKRIVAEATEKERKFFLADLEVMKAIQVHPNVLPIIGCYTASDPWLVMVEYAAEGSLYQYLQHRRPGDLRVEISSEGNESVSMKSQNITSHKLLSLAAQIVNGIQHINRFKMVYYRLRAASILVCKGGTCKLSGFGFVTDITERNIYESNSAPIRWMSPESLVDNIYSIKTDVWQFGILLWEIVHFGHLPYPEMGPYEVTEKIQNGYRMSQPPHCSGDIYNLMLMCWAENPDNRPSFGDIMQNLSHLAENVDSHIDIDKLPEGLKSADIIDNTGAIA